MIQKTPIVFAAIAFSVIGIAACSSSDEPTPAKQPPADSTKPSPALTDSGNASPGKPTAPIDISYQVIGNAIVGSPVSINVVVTSSRGPVTVRYSINDGSALMFQSGQLERLEIADPSSGSVQQLSVIPQREGRLYVNVSAEIETPDGLNIRSMAIPIKVGSAPEKATINGEIVEGPGGEAVISMPAKESN
jgi:hypothetical protein